MSRSISEYECDKCGPVSRYSVLWAGGPNGLHHQADPAPDGSSRRCGPVRWNDPNAQSREVHTRATLHARIADILRRSGVADAEALIRAMERDRAETATCLTFGRDATARIERGWRESGLPVQYPIVDGLAERVARIDRALSGLEIGPQPDRSKT